MTDNIDDKNNLLKRLFTGHVFSQGTIEEIVCGYLEHPRQHNWLLERLLFLLVNSFLRATQRFERARFLRMLGEARETAVNEETRVILGDLIDQVNALEYIYKPGGRGGGGGDG